MLKRLILVLCLAGCSSQPERHSEADLRVRVEQVQAESPELRRMERDLILNLWLHTKSEEKRLADFLERGDLSPEQRRAAQITLAVVQQQANETWLAIFEE